jgi:hypothetical protein
MHEAASSSSFSADGVGFWSAKGCWSGTAENRYLAGDDLEVGPIDQLLGCSITYRIAVGPLTKVTKYLRCERLPACDEPFDEGVGKAAGFSLHAGVAARGDERKKLERLCRTISRPAVSEKRLPLTPNGNVRYPLKSPYRVSRYRDDGTSLQRAPTSAISR